MFNTEYLSHTKTHTSADSEAAVKRLIISLLQCTKIHKFQCLISKCRNVQGRNRELIFWVFSIIPFLPSSPSPFPVPSVPHVLFCSLSFCHESLLPEIVRSLKSAIYKFPHSGLAMHFGDCI